MQIISKGSSYFGRSNHPVHYSSHRPLWIVMTCFVFFCCAAFITICGRIIVCESKYVDLSENTPLSPVIPSRTDLPYMQMYTDTCTFPPQRISTRNSFPTTDYTDSRLLRNLAHSFPPSRFPNARVCTPVWVVLSALRSVIPVY